MIPMNTMYRYLYEYNGEEICVVNLYGKVSKRQQKQELKERLIAKYGSFDKNKLKFKNARVITGICLG